MLYQRYFLRMNQSNTTHILSLLLALVLSLTAVHILFIPMEGGPKSPPHTRHQRNGSAGPNHSSIIFQNNGSSSFNLTSRNGSQGAGSDAEVDIYNRTKEMINHSYYGIENSTSDSLPSNLHLMNYSGRGTKRRKRHLMDDNGRRQSEWDERKQFKMYVPGLKETR